MVSQLVKEFPAFHGSRMFITVQTKPVNVQSWSTSIQSTPHHSYFFITHFNIILISSLPPSHHLSSYIFFPTLFSYNSVFYFTLWYIPV